MKLLNTIRIRFCLSLLVVALDVVSPGALGRESGGEVFEVETLTKQQDSIFGFDFLPGGDILFTERGGSLKRLELRSGRATLIAGTPEVAGGGQGGLLDVRVSPDFATTSRVYLSYSEPLGDGKKTTALGCGRLDGNTLSAFQWLFSAVEASDSSIHFGSRIEFDGQGHLFLSVGERNERDKAQRLAFHNGKILRFTMEGGVPADNPYRDRADARPEIWSLGHRNPQGLAFDPVSQTLWSAEFGPRGGDEINQIRPGLNYGWPVVTYGREYYGPGIGEGVAKPGMEQPVAYYVPSISPSGIGFYGGDSFPAWKGNLFVAALGGQHLRRLVLQKGQVMRQEILLDDLGWRFRAVRTGPDGRLYFSTDEGRMGRLQPVK